MIRTAVAAVLFFFLLVSFVPLLPVCAAFGLRDPLIAVGCAVFRLAGRVLGLEVDVTGRERLDPATPYVFMSNHLSFLDGPLLMAYLGRPARVILKKSIFRLPVLGLVMRYVGFVPVDRKGGDGGKKSIARAAVLMRDRGYSFLIFPEGTRSRDGKPLRFRRGGFYLALESGAPIVPVTIRGTFELMPKGQAYAGKGPVRLAFHDPIPAAGHAPESMAGLMDKTRRAILSFEG